MIFQLFRSGSLPSSAQLSHTKSSTCVCMTKKWFDRLAEIQSVGVLLVCRCTIELLKSTDLSEIYRKKKHFLWSRNFKVALLSQKVCSRGAFCDRAIFLNSGPGQVDDARFGRCWLEREAKKKRGYEFLLCSHNYPVGRC